MYIKTTIEDQKKAKSHLLVIHHRWRCSFLSSLLASRRRLCGGSWGLVDLPDVGPHLVLERLVVNVVLVLQVLLQMGRRYLDFLFINARIHNYLLYESC